MSGTSDRELIRRSVAAVSSDTDPLPGASLALLRELDVTVHGPDTERRIADDQTNASVVVGEDVIVKWLRAPDPVDRGSLLVQHLTEVGFDATPALLGRLRNDAGTLAVAHRYLPAATDGWTWCVDQAIAELNGGSGSGVGTKSGDGGWRSDWATRTGQLAGKLMAALATSSSVIPEPLTRTLERRDLIAACAAEVSAATRLRGGSDLAAAWAKVSLPAAQTSDRAASAIEPLLGVLLHGDLHVGQFLQWTGGSAIVDFDGDPQRLGTTTSPEPPDVDLAHLLVSVELVGSVAAKRRATDQDIAAQPRHEAKPGGVAQHVAAWVDRSRRELLDAYVAELAAAGFAHLHEPGLLAALEVRQLARELEYAEAYLPRFAYASVGALRRRSGR